MIDSVAATPDRELSELVQTTGTTEHPGGVRGALDRLTLEIEASLRQENTLVVWLFDASISLKPRRDQIADRFDNIYRQLGLRGVGGDGALKTVVATFGNKIDYLTAKPIDNVESIQKAIRKIKDDEDGVENIFGAVLDAGRKFRFFRTSEKDRRRVMLIVVTDERGDDAAKLEEAISRLSKLGMRVYCVGDDAVFGRQHHMVPWTYPDGFRELIPVDRGPETIAPESLQLAFWGHDSRHLSELTSGFGPYGLCRLCAETGGLYLISDELPGPKFDTELLRNYLPDYRPIREYEAELSRNSAKSSLVRAASLPGEQIPQPATVFRADKDTTLRQQITEAQKPLAVLDYRLNELETLLDAGEKDRPKLTSPRWRASFDLAAGRVLAMRARSLGYNVMLAEMKSAPRRFDQNGHNTWRINPASESTTPLRIQKLAQRARQYLEAVVEEHRGTQWELLAREELKEPMGWRWESFFVDYPPPAPPRMNVARTPADDAADRMRRQREQARVRPKL